MFHFTAFSQKLRCDVYLLLSQTIGTMISNIAYVT